MDVVESSHNNHPNNNNASSSSTAAQPPHDRFMDVENKNLSRHVIDEAINEVRQAIVTFLTHRTAETIVPTNSRVVILDGSIQLRQAYRALFENDVRAAPVVDISSRTYLDLFCASHALDTILADRGGQADFTTLAKYISLLTNCDHRLPTVKATDSLLQACQSLRGKYRPGPSPSGLLSNADARRENDNNNDHNNSNETGNENKNKNENNHLHHHHHQQHLQQHQPLGVPPVSHSPLPNNQSSPTSPANVHPCTSPSSPAANNPPNIPASATSAVTSNAPGHHDLNPTGINHTANSGGSNTIPTSSDSTNVMLSSTTSVSQQSSTSDHVHHHHHPHPLSHPHSHPPPSLPPPDPSVYHSGHPHRVAIMNDETVLCVLDHGRMLRFVHHHLNLSRSRRLLLSLTLNELQLPHLLRPLISVHSSDSVIHTLHLLRQHQLGAVPVVDDVGKPINVFARSDAACLVAADWPLNILHEPIGSFLHRVRHSNFAVVTCKKCDSLATVFRRFELSRKHRLFVVNDHGVVVSQLTLNDILCFFLEGV